MRFSAIVPLVAAEIPFCLSLWLLFQHIRGLPDSKIAMQPYRTGFTFMLSFGAAAVAQSLAACAVCILILLLGLEIESRID